MLIAQIEVNKKTMIKQVRRSLHPRAIKGLLPEKESMRWKESPIETGRQTFSTQ